MPSREGPLCSSLPLAQAFPAAGAAAALWAVARIGPARSNLGSTLVPHVLSLFSPRAQRSPRNQARKFGAQDPTSSPTSELSPARERKPGPAAGYDLFGFLAAGTSALAIRLSRACIVPPHPVARSVRARQCTLHCRALRSRDATLHTIFNIITLHAVRLRSVAWHCVALHCTASCCTA